MNLNIELITTKSIKNINSINPSQFLLAGKIQSISKYFTNKNNNKYNKITYQ